MRWLMKRQRMPIGWRLGLSVLLSVGLGGLLTAPAAADWVQVGNAGFTPGDTYSLSLALDSADRPYVAYQDWANSAKASVMRWNGSSWEPVGSAGFSAGGQFISAWPWTAQTDPMWRIRITSTATKQT